MILHLAQQVLKGLELIEGGFRESDDELAGGVVAHETIEVGGVDWSCLAHREEVDEEDHRPREERTSLEHVENVGNRCVKVDLALGVVANLTGK